MLVFLPAESENPDKSDVHFRQILLITEKGRKGPKRAEKDRKGPKRAEKGRKEPKRTEKDQKELDKKSRKGPKRTG